jgi:hypothetical protein
MEEMWRHERVLLDQLLRRYPDWTVPQLAEEVDPRYQLGQNKAKTAPESRSWWSQVL